MGRYIFTEKDLEPFRMFLDHPLAQEALAAAIPIKQLAEPAVHVEEATVALAVDVQSRETPHGVPLHDVLSAVQEHAPDVQGLVIRDGTVVVTHAKPPTHETRAKIARVLQDPQVLRRTSPAASLETAGDSDPLVRKLTDPATSDQDWIKAFREYAVKFLIKGEG